MPSKQAAQSEWIAVMGRRDEPTDGVEDFCTFLGEALGDKGRPLRLTRIAWDKRGWLGALRELRRESAEWRGKWALVQYTALGWSRRGFPFGALATVAALRRSGVRCAVVFHEAGRQAGAQKRWIDRVRGACQELVIRRLYRNAEKAIFTAPLETIAWLPDVSRKAEYIPIGANMPEQAIGEARAARMGGAKTVAVYGVTGAPNMAAEVETITTVMCEAGEAVPGLRLTVFGRGAREAAKSLDGRLREAGIEMVAKGVLPVAEVMNELTAADVLLFVRGAITSQRGSALAGIACGLPLVGFRNGQIRKPLDEAGIEWAPMGDARELARGLVRVLNDPQRSDDLRERNAQVYKKYFSWWRIAERYAEALAEQ